MKKINYERKETIRNWGILRKASESFGVSNKTFKGKCECGGSVVTAYDGERVCQNCGKVNGSGVVYRLTERDHLPIIHWSGSQDNQEKQLEADVEKRGWG